MLAEVIQAAAERGLGRVHREPNQPRNSPSRSARRAGHEGGHRNGSGRSGGNRRAVTEAAGERGDRNPGGADRTGKRANRARTALATSPLTKRTSAVSLAGLVFASTMSSPRARCSATRSSRASATCLPKRRHVFDRAGVPKHLRPLVGGKVNVDLIDGNWADIPARGGHHGRRDPWRTARPNPGRATLPGRRPQPAGST